MMLQHMNNSVLEISLIIYRGDITKAAENGDFIALKAYEYTGKILGKS